MNAIKQIGIFGTSGMAREAGDIAYALGLKPTFVARDESELHAWTCAAEVILEEDIEQYSVMPYVIGIGENGIRRAVAERFKNLLKFTNLIHPTATFGCDQRAVIEERRGTIVAAGARFTSGTVVGDFCIFNQNVTVAHDCCVDSYVHVAPGANVSGNVHLRQGCWVGAGAVLNQGAKGRKRMVGENAIIGSGAVVLSDCEPGAVYAGVPAKRIR